MIAGATERDGDRLGLVGEAAGDAQAALVDPAGQIVTGFRHLGGEVLVGAGDGAAHTLGIGNDGLALRDQFLDQVADAQFVVVIGALERGDLVVHERFQLVGAGKGALDAVAHGGDLAADRLADRHDRFTRDRLRLREADGDLAHAARDDAHFLRAADQPAHDEKEHDRQDEGGQEGEHGRRCDVEGGPGKEARAEKQAEADPGDGDEEGQPERRRGGAARQALQQLGNVPAIVIGRRLARRHHRLATPDIGEQVVVDLDRGGRCRRVLGRADRRRRLGRIGRGWCALSLRRTLGRLLIGEVQRVLDRCQGRFRRILDLLRSVRHRRRPRPQYISQTGTRQRTCYDPSASRTQHNAAGRQSAAPLIYR